MRPFTRRRFLAGAGGALLGLGAAPRRVLGPVRRVPPQERGLTLDVQSLSTTLDGTPVKLRTYNGRVPGPVIRARGGDTLHIRVRNHLPFYDDTGWTGDMNVPHSLNTTNLHLHGLEIVPHLFEPLGTSDPAARMIAIAPGDEHVYTVEIPEDQPPGLFWYHPHHHGSTAVQAVSGMAGGLIIEGAIDEVPEIAEARDIVLAMQDIGLFPGHNGDDPWFYEPRPNAIWNTFSGEVLVPDFQQKKMVPSDPPLKSGFTAGDYPLRYFLVNGTPFFKETHNADHQQEPTGTQLEPPQYHVRPGEVVRFRMLNGCSDNLMPIVFEGHELHLLALDGVNFPEPRPIPPQEVRGDVEQLLLAPANRAEFLVKFADAPGSKYRIVQLQQDQQFLFSDFKVIAEVKVDGEPKDMQLPTELPIPTRHYPLIEPGEIVRKRNAVFSATFPGTVNWIVGMDFQVNGGLYQETSVDPAFDDCRLGTAEEWRISVPDSAHGGNEGHPFHIHVNSFEVVSIGNDSPPPGTIMDTIWVHQDSDVVIRMKFRQWTGKSVFHCHILPHEDTGMMKNFLIVDGG